MATPGIFPAAISSRLRLKDIGACPSDAPSADRNRTDPVLQTAEVRAAPPDADPDEPDPPPGTEQGKRAAFSAFLGRLRPGPRGGGKPHLSTRSSFGRRGG